ncbi:disease resistance protein RUN1-like isoform X2 [Fagus crenata]
MASRTTPSEPFPSSSSSFRSNHVYDVFLSFRGKDTRSAFTDHLYASLKEAGIYTFRDNEELPRGQFIGPVLLQAIEKSKISVIVFSRGYASSPWCLDELVKIMECRRTKRQFVLPIFYHNIIWNPRMCGTRRVVLHKHLHESETIMRIVENISEIVNIQYLFVALYPVGIDAHVQDLTSLLSDEVDDVRMVGIWGLGGSGKTTIAKAIYNKFCESFEDKSFLANVRETSNLVHLQNQLLSEILKIRKTEVHSIDKGIFMIKERLCSRKVLVIIDDVDKMEQLDAIARSHDWFGPGSRIIITTRDQRLLKKLDVDVIYTTKRMDDSESLELFSWHAFRNNYPTKDYIDLSRSVVKYSGGLPLALEVLGSLLFSRNMPEWESVLERLKKIPNDQIQAKLKVSYDALDDYDKEIFLDISCFFIGMDKSYVHQILDGCGFSAEIGIKVLIERCLLTVGERNKLMMHDLVRDMGREIVREEYPKEPGERSRLWWHEDVTDILTNHEGTKAVEGLTLKSPRLSRENFNAKAFKKMRRLRLLQLDYVQLTGDYEYLSKELKWLRWHGFPLVFMPDNFYPRKLVAIDLRYSNLREVWKDPKLLEKLKVLNLSHSHYLTQTPDFSKLPKLEKLLLKDCTSLFEVHQSIGDLHHLVFVNLKSCKSLKSLPRSFSKLNSLETLILSGCFKIDHLDENLGEIESLKTFLDNTAIKHMLSIIAPMKNLKYISLCGYEGSPSKILSSQFWSTISPRNSLVSVNKLPDSLQSMNSLKKCHKLFEIQDSDKLLKSIRILLMEGSNNITSTFKQSIPQEWTMSEFASMFEKFLADDRIPDWCTYEDEGDSIRFLVPHIIDHNLEGFEVCIVYSSYPDHDKRVSQDLTSVSIINCTKKIIQISRPQTISPKDHQWQGNFSKSKFNLEDGDEVAIIANFGSGFIIKKIGVSLLYDGALDRKMIHYASTSNEGAIVVGEDVKDHVWPIMSKRGLHDEEAGPCHGWLEEDPTNFKFLELEYCPKSQWADTERVYVSKVFFFFNAFSYRILNLVTVTLF